MPSHSALPREHDHPRGRPHHAHDHAHDCARVRGHTHGHAHAHAHDHAHPHGHGRSGAPAGTSGDSCCAAELSIGGGSAHQEAHGADRRELVRLIVALALALMAEALAYARPDAPAWTAVGMVLAAVASAAAGTGVFRQGWSALRRGDLNINALMTVAVTGAFLIGEWPEAAMVMALYSLAELIEHRSVDRARHAIKTLLDLTPAVAERRTPQGQWESVPAAAVRIGDVVRVRPGERLPLDGRITAGHSALDQSPVTGESLPVEKGPGDAVFAGTVNLQGGLELEATVLAQDTVLAGIIHAVEEAQASRAPTQRFIGRFANVYTPMVFVLAVAVALAGPLLLGHAWLDSLYRALVLLVIACPCALVISTPVTIVSGLAAGARRGILVKGGIHLEQARNIRVLALDKTGTLTEGRPRLVEHHVFPGALDEDRILRYAASLAGRSDHPVSQAIAASLPGDVVPVEAFGAEAGHGVHGAIGGERYLLVNHRKVHESGLCTAELERQLLEHESQGRSVSLLVGPQGVLAFFAVADTVRPVAREAVAELKRLGVTPVMLTGDNATTARQIASQAGIDDVRAGLLPQEKLNAVRALACTDGAVAMVGDGINDAPALAAADIGFAMGGAGTHTAMEAADVVIMNDDLRRLPETIRLSRRTHAVLWQNITLALGIKAVFLLLAVFDHATMWMAVFADMGASLLVVGNGLRMLRRAR
jgi:Cd2+/Zn2+-exporting ATPase